MMIKVLAAGFVFLGVFVVVLAQEVTLLKADLERLQDRFQLSGELAESKIHLVQDSLEERIASVEQEIDSIRFLMGK